MMQRLSYTVNVATATVLVFFAASALALNLHAKSRINRAGSTLGQEQIGPIDNYTCTANGAFPHEECDYFITCWENSAILNRCTEVMLFDLRYDCCNFAEYVDCGDRHRPPTFPGTETPPATTSTVDPTAPTNPSTPSPNGTFTCEQNGVFPHAEKCEYYWSCYQGDATLVHCELDYLFDLRYNGCNFPELTDCQDRERPEGSPPTITPPDTTITTSSRPTEPTDPTGSTGPTTPAPNGTFTCEQNGVFPHAEKCEYYWSCYQGDATLVHCELDYLFDLRYNGCNFPELTDCQDRERPEGSPPTITPPDTTITTSSRPTDGTGPTEPTGSTGSPAPGFNCPTPNGKFPDPDDCAGFYNCVENVPMHEKCPDGLHFNPTLQICDWPASAGCDGAKAYF